MNPKPPERTNHPGVDLQNPWPGLVAFTEELRDFFHGRAEEAEELLRRVGRKNLTVLFGQSGLGKSSLLQAGLFPQLRAEGYLPVPIRLDHAASSPPPSEQVNAAATRAILEAGGRCEEAAPGEGGSLWEHFHRRGLRLQADDGRPICPVLVFDQFEELFAIGQASEETRARASTFLMELADFVENRAPEALERRLEDSPELVKQFRFDDRDCRVLVCLREDYLPHLESLRQSMPSMAENRMRLTRMDGSRALEAVTIPGKDIIDRAVGAQVVRFVAGGGARPSVAEGDRGEGDGLADLEVEPSLLSLVCRELNNRRVEMGLAQITADLVAGNRERILQDFYDRCLADQPPAVRAFVEDELVTDSGLRENIALERATKALARRGAPASAIDELVRRRLLHLEDRLDIQRVELTHDVLTAVVKKSRDERQSREAMLRAEQQAEEVRERSRKQRRRLRIVVAGMTAALVVVGGFGVASFLLYRVSQERLREVERQRVRAELNEREASQARAVALAEKERAEGNRTLADRSFQEARGTVDELLVEMSQEGLNDVPGLQETRQHFAQKAVDRYEAYVARQPDDPDVAEGQARSLTSLGVILGQVGSVEKAVATLERAIRIREGLVARRPNDPESKLRRAQTRFQIGYLYWLLQQFPKARPYLEQTVQELEVLVGQDPAKKEYRLSLARTLNSLGNVVSDAEARVFFDRARTIAQALYQEHPDDPKCLDYLMPPIGNMARLARTAGDYPKALELEEKFLELLEVARKRSPQAPNLLGNRGIGYDNKARILMQLKRHEECLKADRESLASFRTVAQQNPLVSRYQWLLADELRSVAADLSQFGNYAEAKALYEESIEILDSLTQRIDDRPMYGTALIESWWRLAQFYQGNKGDKTDVVTQQQGQLRCLDQAIQIGRKLAKKFPEDGGLHYEFGQALFRRAAYDDDAERKAEAYPFYNECIETFRLGVCGGGRAATDAQLSEFLKWADLACQCAENLKRKDEVTRLATVAYDLGKGCTIREGVQSLGSSISRSAKVHKEEGRYDQAIATYARSLEILRPAFEKAPWHWYLRSNTATAYNNLAECYQKMGDFRNEIKTWREYLTIWSGPIQGQKIADHLDPSRPVDEAEAARLRDFVASAPSMKRFTVPADFNGLKFPFHVYITNIPWPKDPLEDQARWLMEERSGTIPQEIRDSFRRLHKIAYENNVSFIDLCAYAIGSNNAPDAKKEEAEKARKKWSTEIVTLADRLKAEPTSVDHQLALGKANEELAAAQEGLGESKESLLSWGRARDVYEGLRRKQPDDAGTLANIVRVELKLGQLHERWDTKDYQKAYTAYRRSLDFLEQLATHDQSKVAARADVLRAWKGLGSLCKTAFSASEAASWYLKAMDQDDSEAASSLASLYLERPEVAASLPGSTRDLLIRVAAESKNDPRTCPALFATEFSKAKVVQLQALADRQHKVAVEARSRGRRDDYRNALREEFDIRGKQAQLGTSKGQGKIDQAQVAAELARSLLEAKENESAVEWTTRAADLGDVDSILQLADWFEKGTIVKADLKKAGRYRYVGLYRRGVSSYGARRYEEALADMKLVCAFPDADPDDHSRLGMCYGKLGRWNEAIAAYTRGIEMDLKRKGVDGDVLNLLEALIVAEKPDQFFQFLQAIEKKGWQLSEAGPMAESRIPLLHGFRAIALKISGKDASDAERLMREFAGKPGFKMTGWEWDELDGWLKTTKLSADIKAYAGRIIADLKGTNGQ